MKVIIYILIIAVVVFLSRNYIRGFVLDFVNKRRNKKKILPEVNKDFVYTPVISSRTFNFAIEITEVGEGKAIISVVKAK